ncbi:MAG TPA: hypothetical protein DGA22_00575 [Acidobacterium sp.]|nr:hypothetical protein [Acidobacterium sp.]
MFFTVRTRVTVCTTSRTTTTNRAQGYPADNTTHIRQSNHEEIVQMNHAGSHSGTRTGSCGYTSFQPMTCPSNFLDSRPRLAPLLVLLLAFACISGCRPRPVRIAIIPQTTGTPLWGPMFDGARLAATDQHVSIYWNAPTSEDNIKAQIALLERVIHSKKYSGIILAPDHDLALMSAVQDAEAAHIPVVIVSTGLRLPPNGDLSYVLNNDAEGGKWAANYLGKLLHGHGTVAVIGIDPAILGNLQRERSFETTLHESYPNISIAARRFGDYNVPHQTQIAASILKRFPSISAIVAVNPAAERGTWNTLLADDKTHRVKVIGFDQDIVVDGEGQIRINAIVCQNTYKIGQLAVQELLDRIHHRRVAPVTFVSPVLRTSSPTSSNAATDAHQAGASS